MILVELGGLCNMVEPVGWDAHDGYLRLADRKAVFRDPSFTENGPSSLLANLSDLPERLKKNRKRLI